MDRDTAARFSFMEARIMKLENIIREKDAEINLLERMHDRIEKLENYVGYELQREVILRG